MEIHDNVAERRYEVTVEGHLCVLDYVRSSDTLRIDHVGVPGPVEGRGIAAALAAAALNAARVEGLRVQPRCGYVVGYLQRHPEYADLVSE
ncbi:MAG: GNAT family N-acetyltransferase [Tahibacter sp.]